MLEGMIFLQTAVSFEQIFIQLEQAGAFRYILPFLFIFSLIFGILTKTKIFEGNKGINVIISFAVGLMAVQTNYVSNFFAIVSPMLGVGLVVLLISLIFLGLVAPKQDWIIYVVFGVGAIILASILLGVAQETGSWWYDWWVAWRVWIISGILLIIVWATVTSDKTNKFGENVGKMLQEAVG